MELARTVSPPGHGLVPACAAVTSVLGTAVFIHPHFIFCC